LSAEIGTLRDRLCARAGGQWEIFSKQSETRERRSTGDREEFAERREEGWAARWNEDGDSYFAAASSPGFLEGEVDLASRIRRVVPALLPVLPPGPAPERFAEPAGDPVEAFTDLSQRLAAESHGHARLASLTVTTGTISEAVENGAGLAASRRRTFGFGSARAVGALGDRRVGASLLFPTGENGEIPIERLASGLSDRATLPLRGKAVPFPRGQLLLDPAVAAAFAGATIPLFLGDRHRNLVSRLYADRTARFGAEELSFIDDASPSFSFDGEGTPVRRTEVVRDGRLAGRLHDLASAERNGEAPTGNGHRATFRLPPGPGSQRFFIEYRHPSTPADLLSRISRGLYASALVAAPRVDLESDRYELEVEGWAVQAGAARSPVARAVLSGRLSEFWKSVAAGSADRQWFLIPNLVGAPTLFLPRATFGS